MKKVAIQASPRAHHVTQTSNGATTRNTPSVTCKGTSVRIFIVVWYVQLYKEQADILKACKLPRYIHSGLKLYKERADILKACKLPRYINTETRLDGK